MCSVIAQRVFGSPARDWTAQKDLRFCCCLEPVLVLIRWLHAGRRLEETVPLELARHRRNELEAQGATIYWSERLVSTGLS